MIEKECEKNIEQKIIMAARQMFIEKGFQETSMKDIAAQVGINRPTLHYYFHTKEKMFQTVHQSILIALLPKIKDIIINKDIPIESRIGEIVDAYYDLFGSNPCMPLFVMREACRNISSLVDSIKSFNLEHLFLDVRDTILEQMQEGNIRKVPPRFVFLTFYGLMTMPFTSKNICCAMFLEEGESFEDMLLKWKAHVIFQMTALLKVDK